MTDIAYAATYATLKARGVKTRHLARATVAVLKRANRLNVTTCSVVNAFKAA